MLAPVVVVVTRSSSYVALALVADERMSRLEEKVAISFVGSAATSFRI